MDDLSAVKKIKDVLAMGSQLSEINDVDVLLEEILSQARKVLRADAGSIYVIEDDSLVIHFSQNDTMQAKLSAGERLPYTFFKIPISTSTISGYCVATRSVVAIDDAYDIPQNAPYSFSTAYDKKSGYRTKSIIAAPLVSAGNEILGVIQIINKLDRQHNIIEFDRDDLLLIKHFANYTSGALQKAQMTRALLLRMMKMAELRDPKETYHHVNRVGSYATELFERWAAMHKMSSHMIQKSKDILRMAAMLHDVGKVAISDTVLKKPGRFNEEEREIIKSHTYLGAKLFVDCHSDLDNASRVVSMNHHENWDGSGYPGYIDTHTFGALIAQADGSPMGKREHEIPLFARIVRICDAYDALRSKRIYKDGWSSEKTSEEIYRMSGADFDPELVDLFFKILPNIEALGNKYAEESND